jgi:hypothetical protein
MHLIYVGENLWYDKDTDKTMKTMDIITQVRIQERNKTEIENSKIYRDI